MKKSVYIDTTIPSYYFDERSSISFQNQITKKWFSEESQNFDIFISEAVLIELQAGSYPNKKEILNFTSQFEILNNNDEINKIARVYIQNYLMPKDFEGDALHLAFASFYILTVMISIVVISSMGYDLESSLGAVAATLGNIGPGIGAVGPAENYAHFPVFGKWFLSFLMLIGRLELFTVLVILTPSFWRK